MYRIGPFMKATSATAGTGSIERVLKSTPATAVHVDGITPYVSREPRRLILSPIVFSNNAFKQ